MVVNPNHSLTIERIGEIGSGEWSYRLVHEWDNHNGLGGTTRFSRFPFEIKARKLDKHYLLQMEEPPPEGSGRRQVHPIGIEELTKTKTTDKRILSRCRKESKFYKENSLYSSPSLKETEIKEDF